MCQEDGFKLFRRWKVVALVLASSLFAVDAVADRMARVTFAAHIETVTQAGGGGVLFVFHPADCLATAQVVEAAARSLQANGLAVRGLVVDAAVASEALEVILQAANKRFPHSAVRNRTAQLITDLTGSPVVVAVAADGRIVAIEHVYWGESGSEIANRLLSALAGP